MCGNGSGNGNGNSSSSDINSCFQSGAGKNCVWTINASGSSAADEMMKRVNKLVKVDLLMKESLINAKIF